MAKVIGKSEEAAKYAKLAEDIKTAFQEHFVHANGRICGDTQAGYALALAFDLMPENLRASGREAYGR